MPINFLGNTEKEDFFERPQVKAILILLFGVCFFCFVLIRSGDVWKKQNAIENFREDEVIGKISSKYLDRSNRNTPYLLIDNERHYVSYFVWNKIAVGDSVSKTADTNDFRIIKKDTVITITEDDYKKYLDSTYAIN